MVWSFGILRIPLSPLETGHRLADSRQVPKKVSCNICPLGSFKSTECNINLKGHFFPRTKLEIEPDSSQPRLTCCFQLSQQSTGLHLGQMAKGSNSDGVSPFVKEGNPVVVQNES